MKRVITLFFAFAMMLSVAFMGEVSLTGQNPFAAQAQTTVRRTKRVGVVRKIGRGTKYVGRKTWQGTKYVGKKSWQGTKWVGKKTWKTGRKVVSRTKKVVY